MKKKHAGILYEVDFIPTLKITKYDQKYADQSRRKRKKKALHNTANSDLDW